MHRRPPSSLVQNVPPLQPLRSDQTPTSFLPRDGRMKEEVEPLERFERLELILVDSLHQERHDDIRQLLRLFMRDVMTCALHGLDVGVGEKLYPRATHGLHEITFSAVNE